MSKKTWTIREITWLHENYKRFTDREIAENLNRSLSSVKNKRWAEGLNDKTPNGHFKPGQIPWNKGKPFMAGEKSRACQFKPGNLPHNTKHDGAISVRSDKSGNQYLYIRLKKSKWILYHRHLWEQANGKIPRNQIVVFKDGNQMNVCLDNLKIISRSEHMKRNRNPRKAAKSLEKTWEKERIRKKYGLAPLTGFGKLVAKF